jgi:endonuclease YncB( thermonuclease family)
MNTEIEQLKELCLDKVCKIPRQDCIIPARIVKVIDGDTIHVVIMVGNSPLSISIRVLGMDAPETKLKKGVTQLHKDAGLKVKNYVKQLLKDTEIINVKLTGIDKWGGRYLGEVYISPSVTLTSHLLSLSYVKPYYGEKKSEWTLDELNHIINH